LETASQPAGIGRNTFYALLVQGTTAVFTAITTLFLIRALGPEEFGIFSLAIGIGAFVRIIASFGVAGSVARYLAEARDNPAECALLIRDALRLTLLTAGLTAIGLWLAAGPIADAYGYSHLRWALRAVAVAIFAQSLLYVYLKAFQALARIAVNLRVVFYESVVETGATIALVVAGGGVAGAAFGRTIGYVFGAAVATVIVARLAGRVSVNVFERRGRENRLRRITTYALPIMVIDGIYGLYSQIDVLLIGGILNAAAVGFFAAPMRLIPPLGMVGQAVANSVAPRQARGQDARVDAFVLSVRWLLILQFVWLAPLLVWAKPIVEFLFGIGYEESVRVLHLLGPFILLLGVSPLISTTVDYLGRARSRIPIVITALTANVAIDVIFLPRIGISAAAIGTSVAYCLYVPAHFRICYQELGFPLRPILLSFVRALASATAMGAVLWAVGGTQDLSAATAVIGSVLGVLAFVTTLVVTREISVAEIRRAWATARKMTASRGGARR
jgi:O-antigen/teichoic acid export membrane protein